MLPPLTPEEEDWEVDTNYKWEGWTKWEWDDKMAAAYPPDQKLDKTVAQLPISAKGPGKRLNKDGDNFGPPKKQGRMDDGDFLPRNKHKDGKRISILEWSAEFRN
jgi:hypothetical protein